MGDPTSSYATTGIALRVSGAHKPHHHDKMEITSMGTFRCYVCKAEDKSAESVAV
jgi:hypothetical protein